MTRIDEMIIFNFTVMFFSKKNITVIKTAKIIKNEIILIHIAKKLYITSPVLLSCRNQTIN